MKDTFYIIMDSNGVRKMSKRVPTIEGDEIAICITLNVPDEVFEQYIPSTEINVPVEAVAGSRCNISVADFPTDVLIEAEQKIIEVIASRPDCPSHLASEDPS